MMQYVLQAPTVWHSFLAPGLPVTGVTFNAAGGVEVSRNGNGVSAAVMGNVEGRSVAGSWEERSTVEEDRRLALSAEGQVLDDATIREMSTMSFV